MLIRKQDERDILFYAFRYALGRQTYSVNIVVMALELAWHDLSLRDKEQYKREIRECKNLGSDFDKEAWLNILELN